MRERGGGYEGVERVIGWGGGYEGWGGVEGVSVGGVIWMRRHCNHA